MTYLYALCEPGTTRVRYIGKAGDPVRRLRCHLTPASLREKSHRSDWLKSLLARGLKPELMILAEVREEAWQEAERLLIAGFKEMGYDLTNTLPGGEDPPRCYGNQYGKGYRWSDEQRQRVSEQRKGHPVSEETRRKQAASCGRFPRTAEYRAKMSRARTGVRPTLTEEQRAAMRVERRGRRYSEETKRKWSAMATGRKKQMNPDGTWRWVHPLEQD